MSERFRGLNALKSDQAAKKMHQTNELPFLMRRNDIRMMSFWTLLYPRPRLCASCDSAADLLLLHGFTAETAKRYAVRSETALLTSQSMSASWMHNLSPPRLRINTRSLMSHSPLPQSAVSMALRREGCLCAWQADLLKATEASPLLR